MSHLMRATDDLIDEADPWTNAPFSLALKGTA